MGLVQECKNDLILGKSTAVHIPIDLWENLIMSIVAKEALDKMHYPLLIKITQSRGIIEGVFI